MQADHILKPHFQIFLKRDDTRDNNYIAVKCLCVFLFYWVVTLYESTCKNDMKNVLSFAQCR